MKLITTLIIITLFAATSFAQTPFTKLGFKAYSTQAGTTCTVFGSDINMGLDTRNGYTQAFKPDPGLSRSLNLGTKGFANYSTQYSAANSKKYQPMQIWFTCTATGASTAAPVKVYLNGVQTYFLTLSSGTFGGGW
jgi:hypothetical protein